MTEEVEPVWRATVDGGKFEAKVMRLHADGGQLTVSVVESGEVLMDKVVHLSYQAMFGPDVADVADWQNDAIQVIDAYIEKHKEEA